MKAAAILTLLAAVIAGCAAYSGAGLQPGVATEAQVRQTMGNPAMEFAQPDGGKRLVYPKGPLGTQTYMADVGGDGRMLAVRQVLSDDVFWSIQPGLTEQDVLRMIGPPGQTMGFPLSGNYAWDYRYTDTWGYLAIFSVTFNPSGIVVSKITQRIERDKGFR